MSSSRSISSTQSLFSCSLTLTLTLLFTHAIGWATTLTSISSCLPPTPPPSPHPLPPVPYLSLGLPGQPLLSTDSSVLNSVFPGSILLPLFLFQSFNAIVLAVAALADSVTKHPNLPLKRLCKRFPSPSSSTLPYTNINIYHNIRWPHGPYRTGSRPWTAIRPSTGRTSMITLATFPTTSLASSSTSIATWQPRWPTIMETQLYRYSQIACS